MAATKMWLPGTIKVRRNRDGLTIEFEPDTHEKGGRISLRLMTMKKILRRLRSTRSIIQAVSVGFRPISWSKK